MLNNAHKISFYYCNNISSASINIVENTLNIKYAINGTGKSTIAKAIQLVSLNKSLSELTPFTFLAQKEKTIKPKVSNLPFSNVMVFNEDYLRQYVYLKDNLIKDTFEVFIKSQEYNSLKDHIDNELKNIREIARDKPNVRTLKDTLDELIKLLAQNKDGSLSRKKSGVKSLLDDGKSALFNYPPSLAPFHTFIEGENSEEWAGWKLKGIGSFGEKGICPFCAVSEDEDTKTRTKIFKETYDVDSIKYGNLLRDFLNKIANYINADKKNNLLGSLNITADRSTIQLELSKLGNEANYIFNKLEALSRFDGYSIDQENLAELEQQILDMKLSKQVLDFFNTEDFFAEIEPLNKQIDILLSMIGQIKGEIAKFHFYLRNQVNEQKNDINDFLRSAGFSYTFDISIDGDNSAHALLKYAIDNDNTHTIDNPNIHLSWGERNALALLLFMFDAISKKTDLVILDDPISSFDSTKKYAIINRLFKTGTKGKSLYQNTVLLLTHDFEPIIDYIQIGDKVSKDSVCAHFLENKEGNICETEIKKNNGMLPMIVLLKELAETPTLSLPVRVGCLRKYLEHTTKDPKNNLSYNMLSSLAHRRELPTYNNEDNIPLTPEDYNKAMTDIKTTIDGFDYETALLKFCDKSLLELYKNEKNNFFRLLILRAYTTPCGAENARSRLKKHDEILQRYVDETYHIENDYLYSLDVRTFDIVPQYYIEHADNFVDMEQALIKK